MAGLARRLTWGTIDCGKSFMHGLKAHDGHLHADCVAAGLREVEVIQEALSLLNHGLRRPKRRLKRRGGGRSREMLFAFSADERLLKRTENTDISIFLVDCGRRGDGRADGPALDLSADRLSRQACGRSGHRLLRPADRLDDRVADLGLVQAELGDGLRRIGDERGRRCHDERISELDLAITAVLGSGDQRMDFGVGRFLRAAPERPA